MFAPGTREAGWTHAHLPVPSPGLGAPSRYCIQAHPPWMKPHPFAAFLCCLPELRFLSCGGSLHIHCEPFILHMGRRREKKRCAQVTDRWNGTLGLLVLLSGVAAS